MSRQHWRQSGASAIGTVIMLAIIAYGVYVGIQYLPQQIEASTVDSILGSLRSSQQLNPAISVEELRARLDSQLDVNQLNDMKDNFRVSHFGGRFVIDVSYKRELDLLFEKKVIQHERSVPLE
jgi:hypothetical protein